MSESPINGRGCAKRGRRWGGTSAKVLALAMTGTLACGWLAIAPSHAAAAATIELRVGDVSVSEGNGPRDASVKTTVRLSAAVATTQCVYYHTESGTATGAAKAGARDGSQDFISRAGKFVKIKAGKDAAAISSTVVFDTVSEGTESFSVIIDRVTEMSGTTCAAIDPDIAIVDGVGTVTITDDDSGGPTALSIGDSSVVEGNGTLIGTAYTPVRLSAPTSGTCVSFHTEDRTATGAVKPTLQDGTQDYRARTSQTVKIKAGKTAANIATKVISDLTAEDDETYTIVVDQVTQMVGTTCSPTPDPSITVADGRARVTIIDDEPAEPTECDDYPDFESVAGLTLLGDAQQVAPVLRLAPASQAKTGAAWTTTRQPVAGGFHSDFTFKMSGGSGQADGFAFVIQNHAANAFGANGGALGYDGIPNSVAVEFDTFLNPELGDPDANHVSVHTKGIAANDPHESASLGSTSSIPTLADGAEHAARIEYDGASTLKVYVDDLVTPVLTVSVNLSTELSLRGGRAWLGFTAATGSSYQDHDLSSWLHC